MAKFYRSTIVTVLTYKEGGYPADQAEYRVHNLGRGRWLIEDEEGSRWGARTSELGRFFRPRVYEDGYHSSGEPVIAYEEVQILKA